MRTLAISIFMLISTGLTQAQESQPLSGAELLMPFKQNLQQALMTGMAQGPEQAVEVCQLLAPAIAEDLSQDGIHMGRTSDRLRNPANAGPDWATEVLQSYLAEDTSPQPKSLTLENGNTGYLEPILVQPLCLTCHGSEIPESLASIITTAYPNDRATGYQVGDLRGVFWVEYPE